MARRVQILFHGPACPPGAAHGWPGSAAVEIAADRRVVRHSLHRLVPACDELLTAADWLIELELEAGADVASFVRARPCAEVLADLRQLRAQPRVHVVETR